MYADQGVKNQQGLVEEDVKKKVEKVVGTATTEMGN